MKATNWSKAINMDQPDQRTKASAQSIYLEAYPNAVSWNKPGAFHLFSVLLR